MDATLEAVFLDVQVFEEVSFNLKTPSFRALMEHLRSGRLRLISTDITRSEIRQRIANDVATELQGINKSVRGARVLRSSPLLEVRAVLSPLDGEKIEANLSASVDKFFAKNSAETLDASGQAGGAVFRKYFDGDPPFGEPKDKKSEFPDAFVIEALASWVERADVGLFVVSGDQLFLEACAGHSKLHPRKTLAEVLNHIASENARADFIRAQLLARGTAISEDAKRSFEDRLFSVADEEGEAEIEVTEIEPARDPEILQVSSNQATVQMTATAGFNAHLGYTDSATGIWDSEDKVMLFQEQVEETREMTEELVVDVSVTFRDMDPDSFEIQEVDLTFPDDSYTIPTSASDDH